MYEQTNEIGRIGRTTKRGVDEGKALVKSPALVALITKEFKAIEKIEEEIAERRQDIKEGIKRMRENGLSRRGIKAALARRKLVVKGGLEQMDETLLLICSIPSLGVQGDLFVAAEEDAA